MSRGRDDFGLRQFERVIGNIQYGIIAQREAFSKASASFLAACPEASSQFFKAFTDEQAEFRLAFQDLIQFTCGKRSEVIAQRRNHFMVADPGLKRLLATIPPSDAHLFCEERLAMCTLPPATSFALKRKVNPPLNSRDEGPSRLRRSSPTRLPQRTPPSPRKEDKVHRGNFKPYSSSGTGKHWNFDVSD
uniref:Uncharacterized protein n=1 Tax=Cacopsylla melanoneura TaxID=428564 RepID=A0A8D8TZI4_9HEMI